MVHNELVHSGAVEPNVAGKGLVAEATADGFYVYRMPRSDKGVERGPRTASKPVKPVKASKRGPGRPVVYGKRDRITIRKYIREHGYTKGLELLAKERKLAVSKTVARSVAEEFGLTFKRGRPAA